MTGTLVQAVVSLLHSDYTPTAWRAYLIMLAMVALTALVNTYLARKLPLLEGVFFFLTITGFVSIVVVLWVLGAPNRPTASAVFQTFSNEGGWSSVGLSMVAGQELLVWLLTGFDSTVHMAEETSNASRVIPRAMISSYMINGVLNFIMLITYCFSYPDLQNVSLEPSGFQFVQAFALTTGSSHGGAALTSVIIVVNAFAVFNFTASTSRQIFAFARDGGLPGHNYLSRVNENTNTPLYAIGATLMFGVLISLISLGSSVAFAAITSVQLFALVFTYGITIGCLIYRRLAGYPLPHAAWSLGRAGLAVNVTAVAYSLYLIVFIAFPVTVPVTLETLNWSPVIFGGVVVLAAAYYIAYARKVFVGPVAYVTSRT
jgi:choline transport protein